MRKIDHATIILQFLHASRNLNALHSHRSTFETETRWKKFHYKLSSWRMWIPRRDSHAIVQRVIPKIETCTQKFGISTPLLYTTYAFYSHFQNHCRDSNRFLRTLRTTTLLVSTKKGLSMGAHLLTKHFGSCACKKMQHIMHLCTQEQYIQFLAYMHDNDSCISETGRVEWTVSRKRHSCRSYRLQHYHSWHVGVGWTFWFLFF